MTAFTDSEYTYLHELDLEVIKERVEKTTGGEWILDNESDDRPYIADIWFDGEENGHVEIHKYGAATESKDAEFIAHARQDVPALIVEIERLRVVVEGKDKSLRDMANHYNSVQEQLKRSNDWLRYVIKSALDEEAQRCEGQETQVFKMLCEALGITPEGYWSDSDE